MVSFNHFAFGSVGEFYYTHILGIRPLEPGYKKIRIAPVPDPRLGKVSGSYLSRRGRIGVAWTVSGNTVKLHIETPAEAEVTLPDGTVQIVAPGEYDFQVQLTF